MLTKLGERIRSLRTQQGLLLRQVASALEMDTALLSKIERGERPVKKEQVSLIAEILEADKEELLTLWLATQIMDVLKNEQLALRALNMVQTELI